MELVRDGGGAVADIEGSHVDFAAVPIDVQKGLRVFPDRSQGVRCVVVAVNGAIGEGLPFAQAREGQHREIGQHGVGIPIRRQPREAIEDESGARWGRGDGGMNVCDEILESLGRFQLAEHDAVARRQQRGVAGEAEVDQGASCASRRVAEGFDQRLVFIRCVDLPNDVVAGLQAREHPVQTRQASGWRRISHGPSGF